MLQRLMLYVDFKKISINKFEKEIDVGSGTILKAIKNQKGIGTDKLIKIALAYPELDMNWLVTGVQIGEKPEDFMLKKAVTDANGTNFQDKAEWYADRYLKKDYELMEANARIAELEAVVKYLENKT